MKRILIFILAASSCAFAQENRNVWFYQGQGPGPVIAGGVGAFGGWMAYPDGRFVPLQ